jgi:hypothetical protein
LSPEFKKGCRKDILKGEISFGQNMNNDGYVQIPRFEDVYIWYIIHSYVYSLQNIVDSSYSTLLGRPWLKDVKVTHD